MAAKDDFLHHMTIHGWGPAEPLLAPARAAEYGRHGLELQDRISHPRDWRNGPPADFARRPWFKSLHALSPEFYDLATHPSILSRVKQVIGEDVLLWGASIVQRQPDQVHRWHVDLEHATWPGVSVFVALDGVQPGLSGLKFIGGSHRLPYGPNGDIDDDVLQQARDADPACTLDNPPISDGQFMVFNGRVWHGSANRAGRVRLAAILQYMPPSSQARIPLGYKAPVAWSDYAPPCVLAAGQDEHKRNNVVGRPGLSVI